MLQKTVFFLLILPLMLACSSQTNKAANRDLKEAKQLNELTKKYYASIKTDLKNLEQQRNNIMIQGRALKASELAFIDEVDQLLADQNDLNELLTSIQKMDYSIVNAQKLLTLNQKALQVATQIQTKINE
jgi:uncharacterized protein (DUF3084 family)